LQETALKRIRDQADAEGAVQTRNWNDAATGQQETAATLASMLERQRDTEVSKMRRAYYRDKYGNSYPVYSEGDIMSVQGGYDARIDALNREGTEKSASAQAYGRYKSDSLHQAADRLTDQLVGNNLPEGLQLSPVGTNIYVQNYQSVNNYSSPHPPGEMMATQYKLDIDSNVKPQIHQSQRTQDRLSAGQDKLIIDPRKQAPNAATLQVSGKMVVP
jgi:hypothetical protein